MRWFGSVSPNKINNWFWVGERGMASVVRYLSWLSASQVKVSGLCIRSENKPRSALTGNVTQILYKVRRYIISMENAKGKENARNAWQNNNNKSFGTEEWKEIGARFDAKPFDWLLLKNVDNANYLRIPTAYWELQAHFVTRVFPFKIRIEFVLHVGAFTQTPKIRANNSLVFFFSNIVRTMNFKRTKRSTLRQHFHRWSSRKIEKTAWDRVECLARNIQRTASIHGSVRVVLYSELFDCRSKCNWHSRLRCRQARMPIYSSGWIGFSAEHNSKDGDKGKADSRTIYWRFFRVGMWHRTSNTSLLYSINFLSSESDFLECIFIIHDDRVDFG